MIADARRSLVVEAAQRERRQKRRDRRMIVTSMVLSLLAVLTVAALGLPQVTGAAEREGARVVADARQQRITTGREKLAQANAALAARRLPVVAAPGLEVPFERLGDELLFAASYARFLSIAPDDFADDLRERVRTGRLPRVLPSAGTSPAAPTGDGVIEVIPVDPPPTALRGSPDTAAPGTRDRAPRPAPRDPGPRPAPAPPPDRPLLEPCLAGAILC